MSVASIPYFAVTVSMFGLALFLWRFRSELSNANLKVLDDLSRRFWGNGRIEGFYALAALLCGVFGCFALGIALFA